MGGYECTHVGMSVCTQELQCVCLCVNAGVSMSQRVSVCVVRPVHALCAQCGCLLYFVGGAVGVCVVVCVHMYVASSVKGVSLESIPQGCAEAQPSSHTLSRELSWAGRETPADQAPCSPGWWERLRWSQGPGLRWVFQVPPYLPEPQQCDSTAGNLHL